MMQYSLKIYKTIQAISRLFPVDQLHQEIKVENPAKLCLSDSIAEFSMKDYKTPKYVSQIPT